MCNNWNDSNSTVYIHFMGGLLSLVIDTIPFTKRKARQMYEWRMTTLCASVLWHGREEKKANELRIELMPFEVINFYCGCLVFGHFEWPW